MVLDFWIMETINIYEFLHHLNIIKIRPYMNFGGDLALAHICHNTFFFIFFSKKVETCSQAKTKIKSKKHIVVFIPLFFSFSIFKLGFN